MKSPARGTRVVYTGTRHSPQPDPDARQLRPAPRGEDYSYVLDEYATVSRVLEDGAVEVLTSAGRRLTLAADDPRLRRASLIEERFHRDRFPPLEPAG